jgi:predicted lipoprotein with Yx(FWY)xxD motif
MKIPALAGLLAASAVTLSACGGGASSTTAGSPSTPSQGLHTASTSLGKVLVDGAGKTVYMLSADGANKSTCDATCLAVWPAVVPGHAKLGVTTGSTKTPGGAMTATVGGQPVYTFVNDHGPGDVTGEGLNEFGGTWYAVSASGKPVTKASTSGSGTNNGGTYGGTSGSTSGSTSSKGYSY